MLRRPAVLLLISAGMHLTAHAQETAIRSSDGDSLRYSYTPLPPQAPEKRPFLRRVVDYFGESTTDKTFEKKIDFTFAGGPSYSKNTSFGIGLLAAGLYRLDRTDSITAPSDVSIFGNVSVSGFYALGVTGNNIFSHNKRRINYTVMFASAPRSFWGIGYDAGRYNPESTYSEKRYLVEGRYLHEFLPHAYIGGLVSFEHVRGLKFSDPAYLAGQKQRYTATGVGAILEYDSRDFIPSPFRGVYVSFQETLFPKGLGNCGKTLWRTTFTADAYGQIWKRSGCGSVCRIQLRRHSVADARPHGRRPADARLLPGPLYGQRHDHRAGRTAPAHLEADRMRGMGRRGQRFPLAVAIRLVADAAQLRRRTPVGTEKTGERAPRLRIRQENQRFPAEHQRGFLREFV